MTRKRQETDPLAAMAAANPVSTSALAAQLGEGGHLERELERALALGRTSSQPAPAPAGIKLGRRLALGLTAVAIAAVGGLLVLGGMPGGSGGARPEFAAAAIRVAEANPRLLVTAPGWKIVRADEFEPDSGELLFGNGGDWFEIHWYPARFYNDYLHDRADVSAQEPGTLLGQRTTTVEYSPDEIATMFPPQGSVFVEVRGHLGSRAAYDEVLRSLRSVDVETWLSAMPPTTVRPEARSQAVEELLRGVPLPPGFSAAGLQGEDSISDEGSLAVKVGGAVACGWVESWIAARESGDEAAAERAVEAMASSAEWPLVRESRVPWFSNYEIVTEQMREGRLDRGPSSYGEIGGRLYAYGPAWKLLLGCEGTYRREVDSLPRDPNPSR